MGEILSYRDLRVWQAGMDLVEEVYRFTAKYPDRETYGLTIQMRRAAVSIPSNIAIGPSKEDTREYLRHLASAQASLAELQTQTEIAGRTELPDTGASHRSPGWHRLAGQADVRPPQRAAQAYLIPIPPFPVPIPNGRQGCSPSRDPSARPCSPWRSWP